MSKLLMKIAFITCIYGKKTDIPGRFPMNKKYDYFLFTDREPLEVNTSWTVIQCPLIQYESNITKSRYPKFMAWEILPGYDVYIYCDGFLSPRIDVDWDEIATITYDSDTGMMQSRHFSDFCPYNELDRIVECRKDTDIHNKNTKKFFRENNLPNNCGLYENIVFAYSSKAFSMLEKLWAMYTQKDLDLTWRDQPLWAYICYIENYKPLIYEDHCSIRYNGPHGHKMKNLFKCTGRYGVHVYA